jgi:hypothetical protein
MMLPIDLTAPEDHVEVVEVEEEYEEDVTITIRIHGQATKRAFIHRMLLVSMLVPVVAAVL